MSVFPLHLNATTVYRWAGCLRVTQRTRNVSLCSWQYTGGLENRKIRGAGFSIMFEHRQKYHVSRL